MSKDSPLVAMCSGKACRRRDEYEVLRERLAGDVRVERFGCVGVCSGPVVAVLPTEGRPVVIERVRSPKAHRDVLRLVRGRSLTDRLRRRLVSGSKSAKAVRRASLARA